MTELEQKIKEYENKNKVVIAYGGDGTLLKKVHETNGKRIVFPFRDYALCAAHKHRLDMFLDGKEFSKDEFKFTRCPYIQYGFGSIFKKAIAEIVFKNKDITQAMRFNLIVDNKYYMKNVIADGCIISTKFGSTGYFKSVSRCIFNCEGIGVGFIAPTQGISNLVLNNTSDIMIEFLRDTNIIASNDTEITEFAVKAGEAVRLWELPDAVGIYGLEAFHCQKCRELRHSTIENGISLQDQYTK